MIRFPNYSDFFFCAVRRKQKNNTQHMVRTFPRPLGEREAMIEDLMFAIRTTCYPWLKK